MQHDTPYTAMARAKWPGYEVNGNGQFACACKQQRTVWLYELLADAHTKRMERKWSREVFQLQPFVVPKVWEKDDYDGPEN